MTSRPEQTEIRIVLVGCGAIAKAHAKAIAATVGVRCLALFDTEPARAEALRRTYFLGASVLTKLESVADHADAAIVAVPNAYHAPVTITLLRAGLHVLCQKPLATTLASAREMAATAVAAGRVLACVPTRRLEGATELIITALRQRVAGLPRRFEVRESAGNWPLSRATFDPKSAGGGVFIDLAPHWLAQLAAWLGPVELLEYQDDNRGGVEGTAVARIRCRTSHGDVNGDIFLTRACGGPNYTRIHCDGGTIEADPTETARIKIALGRAGERFATTAETAAADPFARQLQNFIGAIRETEPLVMPTEAAVATVGLIESAYRSRRQLSEPWAEHYAPAAVTEQVAPYRKILVTGAAGLIGSRLVEMWTARDQLPQLRCMVRSYRTAARLMRFPVETVEADLTDSESVRRAAAGCDAIIHLALGARTDQETRTLLKAARYLGIRRFVHVSSAAVYGMHMPQRIEAQQEQAEIVKTGEPYADRKAAAERAVRRECARGLEGIILRPHIVYGPYMRWSAELMELLTAGRIPLIEDGGWCNLIYVDDLVGAIARTLAVKQGFGQPLFITDGAPIRWRDYIETHAALIGARPPRRTRAEVVRGKLRAREWLRASVRSFGPVLRSDQFRAFVFESPAMQATLFRAYLALRDKAALGPLVAKLRRGGPAASAVGDGGPDFDQLWTSLQLSEARLSPGRAESVLGFRATVDFAEGMRRSTLWFERYALIPSATSDSDAAIANEPALVETELLT
jgi:predicted dehydrogenase/nucleoside-diphosphate-sugar epimerase